MGKKPHKTLCFVSEAPSTPDRVINIATMFEQAVKRCADADGPGELTLTVDNYQMKAVASARDELAARAVSRFQSHVRDPLKAVASSEGRDIVLLVQKTLRGFPYGSRLSDDEGFELEVTEDYWQMVSAAFEQERIVFSERTNVAGVLVGVRMARGVCKVMLRTERGDFEFETAKKAQARDLFDQRVVARVEFLREGSEYKGVRILSLKELQVDEDVAGGFRRAREKLLEQGIHVHASDWHDKRDLS